MAMGHVMLLTMLAFALIGAGIGIVLKRNGIIPYGIGQQYGSRYAKGLGVENKEKPVREWKDQ